MNKFIVPMVLLIVAATVGTVYATNTNDTYVFVHCYDEGTGGTINYPPGTECLYPDNYYNNGYPNSKDNDNELTDDDLEEEEEEQDEKEHADESREYDNNER